MFLHVINGVNLSPVSPEVPVSFFHSFLFFSFSFQLSHVEFDYKLLEISGEIEFLLSVCCFDWDSGLALITMNEALLWTDGRYFLQATQELTGEWKLMRMLEDPAVDVWMANVSCRLFYYIIIKVIHGN